MNFERMHDWNTEYFSKAKDQIGKEALTPIWRQAYSWQITLSELALSNLGLSRTSKPHSIPNIGEILNLKPFGVSETGLINVVGMPGAGKDTMIRMYNQLGNMRVTCASEEGYFWSKEFDPAMRELRKRHIRAYGGIEIEIDEMMNNLSKDLQSDMGVGIMNRSNEDNFLAFAYSFFLSGYMGVPDLIMSQKFYHYFQYHPSLKLKNTMVSQDEITAATIVLMVDPITSLERKKRSGRIMNESFLGLLYSQYLRMIWRMRESHYRNFVVLDMTEGVDSSFNSFQQALDMIIG